jgi:FMN phosphatase YigB (HAD superfamily)
MAPPKWLLMDLGGVMCEFHSNRRLNRFAELSGRTPDEVSDVIYGSDLGTQADRGLISAAELRAALAGGIGVAVDDPAFAGTWASAFVPALPVLTLVARARRSPAAPGVALFTNNDAWLRELLPTALPTVAEQVDRPLFSCELGWMKPDRRAFERALEILGVPAGDTVFVDDSSRNVAAAAEVGIDSILFTSADELAARFRDRGLLAATGPDQPA